MSKVTVLIPAAGAGKRMQSSTAKQFLPLGDRPVLAHTLAAFQRSAEIDEIIPILSEEEQQSCREQIIDPFGISKARRIVAGGKERQDSVYNGLRQLDPDTDVVLVHDGVRPFVTGEMIRECVLRARRGDCVAVGVPVKDTVKLVDAKGRVRETLDRSKLWAIQTPQAFPARILLSAYEAAYKRRGTATDDAMLVEREGGRVTIIMGSYENIKITTPDDLLLAEEILKRR